MDKPMKRILTKYCLATLALVAIGLGLSCQAVLLDAGALAQAKDTTAPELVILSPADGHQCANIVEIGRASCRERV